MEDLCAVCKENPAINKCAECGIALCEICSQEVVLERSDPAYRHKGVSASAVKPSSKKKIFCLECVKDVDLF